MSDNTEIILKEIQDNNDLNRYNRELLEDTKLTKINIREKSLMVSSLRVKWLNYRTKERDNLKRIKEAKDTILREKLGKNNVQQSVLRMKSEDVLSGNDERIKKLNIMNDRVKENIDFLEHALGIINDFGHSIRNSIEIFKLEGM